jgi:RNA polymerase sigma factor (TIGR02999 family)
MSEVETTRGSGDEPAAEACDPLFEAVYARLKAMASRRLSAQPGATLDTTALVHELYLRIGHRELAFADRAQFYAYAARAMRHLLADRARDRLRLRAGGGWMRVTLEGGEGDLALGSAEEALALDQALQQLADSDPRAARVVELRYFAGLGLEAVADLLGLARRTVDRDWRFARAFLHERLS